MKGNKRQFFGGEMRITDRPLGWGRYDKVLKACEVVSLDEQVELAIKAQHGCQKSLDKLVRSNMKLVVSIAKYYYTKKRGRALDLFDFIQNGNTGLCKAVYQFKNTRDCSFPSFAVLCIKGEILNFFYQQDFVRIPNAAKKDENGERKLPIEIVYIGDELPEKMQGDGLLTYQDLYCSGEDADVLVRQSDYVISIRQALDILDQSDRDIILLYFYYRKELQDIAELLGFARTTARHRLNKAITKLRRYSPKCLVSLREDINFIGSFANENLVADSDKSYDEVARGMAEKAKAERDETGKEQLERLARKMEAEEIKAEKARLRAETKLREKEELIEMEREGQFDLVRKIERHAKESAERVEQLKAQAEFNKRRHDVNWVSLHLIGLVIVALDAQINSRAMAKKAAAIGIHYNPDTKSIFYSLFGDGCSLANLDFKKEILGDTHDMIGREQMVNDALIKGENSLFKRLAKRVRRDWDKLKIFICYMDNESPLPVLLLCDEFKFLIQLDEADLKY